jgi:hypothetical protein
VIRAEKGEERKNGRTGWGGPFYSGAVGEAEEGGLDRAARASGRAQELVHRRGSGGKKNTVGEVPLIAGA